jgi:hypothetical protein
MARIRSVHPGLWTDERFVGLSAFARLFFMGLWGECDDFGSFEWSPLKLKMRLLPADNVDPATLLAELFTAGAITSYEVDGRTYGAVRNFCQYQRPKKPTATYPQSEAVRQWVGTEARAKRDGGEQVAPASPTASEPTPPSTLPSSEPVGNQLPTSGEKARQMKDGGGRSSSVADATAADPPNLSKLVFDEGVKLLTAAGKSTSSSRSMIARWAKTHGDGPVREALISAVGRAQPVSWIEKRLRDRATVEDEARALSRARADRYRQLDGPPPEVMARMQNGAFCLPEPADAA